MPPLVYPPPSHRTAHGAAAWQQTLAEASLAWARQPVYTCNRLNPHSPTAVFRRLWRLGAATVWLDSVEVVVHDRAALHEHAPQGLAVDDAGRVWIAANLLRRAVEHHHLEQNPYTWFDSSWAELWVRVAQAQAGPAGAALAELLDLACLRRPLGSPEVTVARWPPPVRVDRALTDPWCPAASPGAPSPTWPEHLARFDEVQALGADSAPLRNVPLECAWDDRSPQAIEVLRWAGLAVMLDHRPMPRWTVTAKTDALALALRQGWENEAGFWLDKGARVPPHRSGEFLLGVHEQSRLVAALVKAGADPSATVNDDRDVFAYYGLPRWTHAPVLAVAAALRPHLVPALVEQGARWEHVKAFALAHANPVNAWAFCPWTALAEGLTSHPCDAVIQALETLRGSPWRPRDDALTQATASALNNLHHFAPGQRTTFVRATVDVLDRLVNAGAKPDIPALLTALADHYHPDWEPLLGWMAARAPPQGLVGMDRATTLAHALATRLILAAPDPAHRDGWVEAWERAGLSWLEPNANNELPAEAVEPGLGAWIQARADRETARRAGERLGQRWSPDGPRPAPRPRL